MSEENFKMTDKTIFSLRLTIAKDASMSILLGEESYVGMKMLKISFLLSLKKSPGRGVKMVEE